MDLNDSDFVKKRREMITYQLVSRDISDLRVLEAMNKIPRHQFVLPQDQANAYADYPLPIGQEQTISQPYMVALMTECLELKGKEKILEIGTGSGYQTAILSALADKIYTMERIPELAQRAKETLQNLGFLNVEVIHGDGTKGLPEHAPYDGIIVTAAAAEIPQPLLDQLAQDGKLVIPVGRHGYQDLLRIKRSGDNYSKEHITGCVFVPLLPGMEQK